MALKAAAKKNVARKNAGPGRGAATKRSRQKKSAGSQRSAQRDQRKLTAQSNTFPIVAIGGSAGAFEATMELLQSLPPRKNKMAFVVVQHLDPHHASSLPKLLARGTQMPVVEVGKRVGLETG